MSDAMFSGWGVRTLSTDDRGYNPIGYHIGTIWPHDNAIIALGLARAGFRDEANRITLAQAAAFTGYRRFRRRSQASSAGSAAFRPVPDRLQPQAWATAAPFVFVQAMLGLGPATACYGSTHACRRSAAFPFAACTRSGRSGMSRRSAPRVRSAAPGMSTPRHCRPLARSLPVRQRQAGSSATRSLRLFARS